MTHVMKAKNDGVILHYLLLPSDQLMQSYDSFATLSYVDWNRRFFQKKIALLEFLAPVRVKSNSGWLNTWSILALSMLDTPFPAFSVVVPPSESRRMISTCRSQIRVFVYFYFTFFENCHMWWKPRIMGSFCTIGCFHLISGCKGMPLSRHFPTLIEIVDFFKNNCLVRVFCPC